MESDPFITPEQVREWERLCERATPGPWFDATNKIGCRPTGKGLAEVDFDRDEDRELCVEARTALPALLAERRRVLRQKPLPTGTATECVRLVVAERDALNLAVEEARPMVQYAADIPRCGTDADAWLAANAKGATP